MTAVLLETLLIFAAVGSLYWAIWGLDEYKR
jgi:hypothetical protein